jgi:hypothetical protein
MFTFNLILGVLLSLTLGLGGWWSYSNWNRRRLNGVIGDELQQLLLQTKKMAEEAEVYLLPGDGANKTLDYNSPAMLGTLVSVIVHKLGDLRLSAEDFDISADDHVSVYVDIKTHDVILSTNHTLEQGDPLSQMVNFTDSDDTTFH